MASGDSTILLPAIAPVTKVTIGTKAGASAGAGDGWDSVQQCYPASRPSGTFAGIVLTNSGRPFPSTITCLLQHEFAQSLATAALFVLVLARDVTFAAGAEGGAWISEDALGDLAWWTAAFTVAVNFLSLVEYSRDVPELIAEYTGGEK